MRIERSIAIALAWTMAACGAGHRSEHASPPIFVASGLQVAEVGLPESFAPRLRAPGARLFVDRSGDPILIAPGALLSVRDGQELAVDARAPTSAVALDDGQWVMAAQGALHLMRGEARVQARPIAGANSPVRVAPAGALVVYAVSGSQLGLLDIGGDLRRIAGFRSPIAAVAGTGDLSFVALENGSVWMLRLGREARPVMHHRSRILGMALDPNGYVVFSDESTVYALVQGRAVPLVAGIARPQLAASRDGFYVYSAPERRLLAVRGVVDVEAAVAR